MDSSTHPSRDDLLAHAQADLARGYYSVRLAPGKKRPSERGWNTLRLDGDALKAAFEGGENRGRLLGLPMTPESGLSGYGVCVDLDCDESIGLAAELLPETSEVGGRSGAPQSHWFFRTDTAPRTLRLSGPDKTRYVELLAQGSQVVVPPSVHPSGEPYVWESFGVAAEIALKPLRGAIIDLAIATLCQRCAGADEVSEVLELAGLSQLRSSRVISALSHHTWQPASPRESSLLATHIRGWLALG